MEGNKKMAGVGKTPFTQNFKCLCFVTFLLLHSPCAHSKKYMYFTVSKIYVMMKRSVTVHLVQIGQYSTTLTITARVEHPYVLDLEPQSIQIPGVSSPSSSLKYTHTLYVVGKNAGHSQVTFHASPRGSINMKSVFLDVTVMHSYIVKGISDITGWMYFVAWSVSFYPQIYINYTRKSVVGLNFDFLALNIMGYTMYSVFNCGLYYNRAIQSEYFKRYPRGHNPVHLNDVFFSLHATFATFITITQTRRYERANQRVSTTARVILGVMAGLVLFSAMLSLTNQLSWLGFLYYCSYIKLATTLIKCVPQAVMNYRRKSTVGWSIGYILLDFTGGNLSLLQMVLNGWNYKDWNSFWGDVTKCGLGFFSLIFDLFFMLQHYVIYRKARQQQAADPPI